MRTVSVSKLKASLSEYLRYITQGEDVTITDHGHPIARMTSVRIPTGSPEHMKDLVRRGVVRMGSGKLPDGFWEWPRPKVPPGTIQRIMDEEREDRL